ncbi:hypothetical protein Asi03nite_70540 [Actinoplanes siamensis]|uniref:Uncharacterized protein n=1 Tax=Actinoplanes siamensis TaxID=1223317 RepID=A0A919TNH9_9ACTN|nr:hypothetical protein Asi03nite_70540 [Actinoplanes siamensis]
MPEPLDAGGQTPPINPPTDCASPLIWRLARRLYADHQPGPDGWCLNCRPAILYPCVARQFATSVLRARWDVRRPVRTSPTKVTTGDRHSVDLYPAAPAGPG